MQQIVGSAQPGALELGGPTRADTFQKSQLTLQWVMLRGTSRVCVHLRWGNRPLDRFRD